MKITNTITNITILLLAISEQAHGKPSNYDRCVGDPEPNAITRKGSDNGNGSRFAFRLLNDGNEMCTDDAGDVYQWGRFNNIRSFEDCAVTCVEESPLQLINDGVFRGFNFDCKKKQCMCLFDEGELDSLTGRERSVFRGGTDRKGRGYDSIDRNRGKYERDIFCGSLVGFMEEEVEVVLQTDRPALRGGIKLATIFEGQVAEALGNYEEEGCKGDGKPCTHANQCCNDFCVPNNDGVSTTCAEGESCTCA